jgi:hypothetical protein
VSTSGARRRGRGSVFRRNGPRRTGCVSCGKCNIGCGYNAKNKLTTNYLYLAERLGDQVHGLHEVHDLVPLEGGGFEYTPDIRAEDSAPRICSGTPTPPSR